MELLIVLSAVLSLAVAAPVAVDSVENSKTQLLSSENDNKGTGSYKFSYILSDGQAHVQEGELRTEGPAAYVAVKGYYSWYSPDDTKYFVQYTADQNGFQQTIKKSEPINKSNLTLDIISKLLT